MPPPLPRRSIWTYCFAHFIQMYQPCPKGCRVGLRIVLFEDCSAFTRVAARTLARSPICDQLPRRLQPFCYLHDCSGCFRLERLPGGACTHWKAPPCHGAHVKRTLGIGQPASHLGGEGPLAERREWGIAGVQGPSGKGLAPAVLRVWRGDQLPARALVGDLPLVSRQKTVPREAARTRRACGIRTR